MSVEYINALVSETRRRIITESIQRIRQCLVELSEEQIWYRPNNNSNAVGNLVLHLCGNVRQWIIHGLAGADDVRQRDSEFEADANVTRAELMHHLDHLEKDLDEALAKISSIDLLEERLVQQYFKENGVSILVHAIEHFSYHTGQITYITKMLKDIDTGYYADLDL